MTGSDKHFCETNDQWITLTCCRLSSKIVSCPFRMFTKHLQINCKKLTLRIGLIQTQTVSWGKFKKADKNFILCWTTLFTIKNIWSLNFSLPVTGGQLRILLLEDRANAKKRSIRICEPSKNYNAVDAEIKQETIFQEFGKN